MKSGPAATPSECWHTDRPSRPPGGPQQPSITVVLPEDPPLLTGQAATVLLRLLAEAAGLNAGRKDHAALKSRPGRGRTP
jgi:hypothetical protein